MPQHLSEDELRRISAFADRPMYEREPEQLLPDTDDGETSDQNAGGN
jgi:hypothetical protein